MASRRIVLVNERDPLNPLAGGAEVHVFEIFKRLVDKGHRVSLIAASFPGCLRRETVEGIEVTRIANRYLYFGLAPFALRRTVRRERVDVVVDVLNKLPFLSPWTVPVPSFAIVHHLMGDTAFRQVAFPIAAVAWLSEKLIPMCYSEVPMLAISPSTKDDLIARGLPGARIRVIPPGIDRERYLRPPGRDREPLVVWIGRLEPYKRAEHMLEALPIVRRSVPDAKLVVIGDGSARRRLQAIAARLGLDDAVVFTGHIDEARKIDYLQRASVVVNTSEKEGWGLTVIEANACGCVSVSSDVAGLRDSVQHDRTGLLYPFGDRDALAEAVTALLADPDRRARMADEAYLWAQRFTWDEVVDGVEALMEETIERKGSIACAGATTISS